MSIRPDGTAVRLFHELLALEIGALRDLCAMCGAPGLGRRVTLFLRDPDEQAMCLIQGDDSVDELHRLLVYLEREGVDPQQVLREAGEDAPE